MRWEISSNKLLSRRVTYGQVPHSAFLNRFGTPKTEASRNVREEDSDE
jgi:hypothetical protein